MKKISILLSLMVAAAMVLSACSIGNTPTPAVTTAPTSAVKTGLPGTGATATMAPTKAATSAATQSSTKAAGTPQATGSAATPQSTRAAGTPQAGGTAGIPATGRLMDSYRLMSVIMTFKVVDSKNQTIGEVDDMIMDICNARMVYLVITPDASLGMTEGSALVIPFSAINTDISGANGGAQGTGTPAPSGTPSATGTPTGAVVNNGQSNPSTVGSLVGPFAGISNRTFILRQNVTIEMIKKAPIILGVLNILTPGWDQDVTTYWSKELNQKITTECMVSGLASTGGNVTITSTPSAAQSTPAATPMPSGTPASTAVVTPTQAAATPVMPVVTGTPSGSTSGQSNNGTVAVTRIVFASRLRGAVVVDGNMNKIGTVVDAILNQNLSRIDYIIVQPDASLNLPKPGFLAVPSGAFNVQYKNNDKLAPMIVILVDTKILTSAPVLTGNIDISSSGWDTEIASYWQQNIPNQIPNNSGGASATPTP